MFDFLKTFGQGLLYLVLSPFILLMVVFYTIYSFFVFFFMFFKRIFLFFAGYDMKEEMKIESGIVNELVSYQYSVKEEE